MTLIVIPAYIAEGFQGGPTFATSAVPLSGGREARNAGRTKAVWKFAWDYENRTAAQNAALQAFFMSQRGMFHGFLIQDFIDDTLEDGPIGVGDGATVDFDLIKIYNNGNGYPYTRSLLYIDEATLVVKVNGVITSASFAQGTGVVTIVPSSPPGNGEVVSVSCDFYVPVRFDSDALISSADGPQGSFRSIRNLTATEIIP